MVMITPNISALDNIGCRTICLTGFDFEIAYFPTVRPFAHIIGDNADVIARIQYNLAIHALKPGGAVLPVLGALGTTQILIPRDHLVNPITTPQLELDKSSFAAFHVNEMVVILELRAWLVFVFSEPLGDIGGCFLDDRLSETRDWW